MHKLIQLPSLLFILLFLFMAGGEQLSAQAPIKPTENNDEITIYVIPSVSPIDWSNPSALFKSTEKCYFKALFKKNYYVIGHTLARIKSSLRNKTYYIAMTGADISEKPKLVYLNKLGFGALGATIKGEIEPYKNIARGLKLYSGRDQVRYIKFKTNDKTICRVLSFIEKYQTKMFDNYAPCELYNGATWARFDQEGSGCSGFGMSILDVAGLLPSESSQWQVNVKIPMDLIGGEFNNNKKISTHAILKRKTWYEGNGKENTDWVAYNVFDPNIIFNWINNMWTQNSQIYKPEKEDGIKGIVIDKQDYEPNNETPIFTHRTDTSLFQRQYYKKLREKYPYSR